MTDAPLLVGKPYLSSLPAYAFVFPSSLIIEDSVGDGDESTRRGYGEAGA